MSKRAEILHRLNTDDRIYLSEKFKEKDEKIKALESRLANCIEQLEKVKEKLRQSITITAPVGELKS